MLALLENPCVRKRLLLFESLYRGKSPMTEDSMSLTPVSEEADPVVTLGYRGLALFSSLEEESRIRVNTTREIEELLTRHGFTIYGDEAVAAMKRQAVEATGRSTIRERWSVSFRYALDKRVWLGKVMLYAFFNLVFALILAVLIYWETLGWSADWPVLVAVKIGMGTALALAMPEFLYNFTRKLRALKKTRKTERFNWYRVGIHEYIPPLISPDVIRRLEMLKADLREIGPEIVFSILHGTVNELKSVKDTPKSLTARGNQLQAWSREVGLIQMDVIFNDGEKDRLTIARMTML